MRHSDRLLCGSKRRRQWYDQAVSVLHALLVVVLVVAGHHQHVLEPVGLLQQVRPVVLLVGVPDVPCAPRK